MIVALRVDDRLIHGQVALAWSKTLSTEGIVVANEAASKNPMQKMTLQMALPVNTKLIIQPVADAAKLLNNPKAKAMRIMVLVNTVKDALYLCRQVEEIKEVNLAGAGRLEGGDMSKKVVLVKSCVFLREAEMESLEELIQMGIKVYHQPLPTDDKTNVANLLANLKK